MLGHFLYETDNVADLAEAFAGPVGGILFALFNSVTYLVT